MATTGSFIKRATNKFGALYDYSLVKYVHSKKLITIICKTHGEFQITPTNHLKKNGHGGCVLCAGNQKKTTEDYVRQATKIHNNFYDYSQVEYLNKDCKILIICPNHGPFFQKANNHLNGCKCPKCAIYYNQKDTLVFKAKANKIHEGKYNYSRVEYDLATNHVNIICPKHGEFQQRAYAHLNGQGCPRCSESSGERLISIGLNEMNVQYDKQIKFEGCKNKRKLSFDFGIFKNNILLGLIEYQGKQHYQSIKRFGGEEALEKILLHDQIKADYCKNYNIPLLLISYKDKNKIPELLFKFVNNKTKEKPTSEVGFW